jgi:NRPS condensation-like uncharacterized protein
MSIAPVAVDSQLAAGEPAPPSLEFPLAFTPFERLMLLDDQPDYPMTIHVELGFTGRMEKEVLLEALGQTMLRHPLLNARISWRRGWPYWFGPAERGPKVQWHDEEPPELVMRPPRIDLVVGPGVEVHVYVGAKSTSLLVMFHHSCCDGQGARRFLFDLVSAYDRIALGEQSVRGQAKVDILLEERLKRRHEFAAGKERPVNDDAGSGPWQRIKNAVAHITTGCERLSGPQQGQPHAPGLVHNVLLEVEETANLRRRAQEEEATFNDVAVAKLMQVCAAWNREHENAPESRHVRVCMPTDLRLKEDDSLPAANRMGYAFLTRQFSLMHDWPKLLASVREETNYIKEYRVGIDFVNNMALVQKVPLLLPLLLKTSKCLTTTVLTNLGDATRRLRRRFPMDAGRAVIGGLPLDSIKVTPPVRPGTRAGFGMCICGGRLAISVLTDPHLFDDADTRRLLDSYANSIRQWNRGE